MNNTPLYSTFISVNPSRDIIKSGHRICVYSNLTQTSYGSEISQNICDGETVCDCASNVPQTSKSTLILHVILCIMCNIVL